MQLRARSSKGTQISRLLLSKKIDNKLLWQCLGTTLLPKLLTLHICFVHSPPPLPGINGQRPANTQALASSNSGLLVAIPTSASVSAFQHKSRIAMRTWRRTLPKRMTTLHAHLRRCCSWKPHPLHRCSEPPGLLEGSLQNQIQFTQMTSISSSGFKPFLLELPRCPNKL